MNRRLAAIALAVLALVLDRPAVAEPRQAPGSRVQLDLSADYEAASLFSGFTNEALGVSFVVVELPEQAYMEVAAGMTPETLAQRGVQNAARGSLSRADSHVYMQAEQSAPAGDFAKFFVAFRDGGLTALVTANVQKASLQKRLVTTAEIEQVLASARVADAAAPAKELFRLGYHGAFKPAGQFLGTARLFTLEGQGVAEPNAGKAMLIVAPSLDRRPIAAPDDYAVQLLAGLDGLKDASVLERRRLEVAGEPSVELIADASDRKTGEAMFVYQVIVFARAGGYFRLVGQGPAAKRSELLPELQKIASSLELLP